MKYKVTPDGFVVMTACIADFSSVPLGKGETVAERVYNGWADDLQCNPWPQGVVQCCMPIHYARPAMRWPTPGMPPELAVTVECPICKKKHAVTR